MHLLPRPQRSPWLAPWTPWLLLAAAGWGQASQRRSRRNARVASTALLRRRQELLEVDEFLLEQAARRAALTADVGGRTA